MTRAAPPPRLRIGEFSALGRVSVRMLRHYDRLGLLRPAEVDAATGYRSYAPEQLSELHRLVALKELGFTLDEVGGILRRDPAPTELRALLEARRRALAAEVADVHRRLAQVDARLAQIERADDLLDDAEVVVGALPAAVVASLRRAVADGAAMGAACAAHVTALTGWLAARELPAEGTSLNLYHMTAYRETDLDVETAIVVDPAALARTGPPVASLGAPPLDAAPGLRRLTEVPEAAVLTLRTGFADVEAGVLALLGWVAARGWRLAGPLREVLVSGHPGPDAAPGPFRVDLAVPVTARSAAPTPPRGAARVTPPRAGHPGT